MKLSRREAEAGLEVKPTGPSDLPELLGLWNDGRVMGRVGFPEGLGFDLSRVHAWWTRLEENPRRRHFVVRAPSIGFCGELYYSVEPQFRRAGLDIKLLPEAQGGSRSAAALLWLIRRVFEVEAEVDAVWTEPSPENLAARTLYWRCGLRPKERPSDLTPGSSYWELSRETWRGTKEP